MKQSRFTNLLFFAAFLLFLTSCGNSETETVKTDEDTSNKMTNTQPNETPEKPTIITTPESMLTVVHKVSNFAKWKPSYDEHDSMRLANGLHSYVIGRGVDDSNMVLVALKADDMNKAKAFTKDPSLKKAMQKGGVTGAPTISFFTTIWQDISPLTTELRSRTSFTVKDWAAWEKNFLEGKQERMDNGIVDRTYGHDADDDKKVSLVTAITDTAKAFAYWKSDALKKRREAGGVIGEPKRFLFRVVQRY